MTMTPTATPAAVTDAVDIDLTDLSVHLDRRHAMRFNEQHVVEWLRSSGGTLTEQIMKRAAADTIERYASAAEATPT